MNRLASLDTAFNPSSIAIAGVGPVTGGKGYLDSLVSAGFRGKIYPLNPKGGEISGLKVHPNVRDIPGPVDYVISCVPAASVPQLIQDCWDKGVKVASLFTAGFSESGTEKGRQLEREVQRLARAGGVRIIGPNCMGVYSPRAGLSFVLDFPREGGGVAFVCQSGGNAIYFVRGGARRGVRFSKVISYGNACDVDETDLLEYLTYDTETEIVAAYIEGVKDGNRFRQVLRELAARKPVIVLKGGITPAGARTAASHTSALSGSETAWDALLRQVGAIRVDSMEELIDMTVTLLFLPQPRGRRVAMVGGGGGACVLATDVCAANGFVLPSIPPEVGNHIRSHLVTDAGTVLTNPIELNMYPESSYSIARSLLSYEAVDFLLVNCVIGQHPWPMFDTWFDIVHDTVVRVRDETGKPAGVVLPSDIQGDDRVFVDLQRRYYEAGFPVYHSMSAACRAIDRFLRYCQRHPSGNERVRTPYGRALPDG